MHAHAFNEPEACRRILIHAADARWAARPGLNPTTSCGDATDVIGCGSFRPFRELTAAIGAFTGHWNDHPRTFAWTKDADEILSSINHAKA